jgi:type IV secretion system protein VirB10
MAPHDLEDDEPDDDGEPRPFWHRRNVQLIGLAGVLLLVFLFTRGHAPQKPQADKNADQFIGVVVPYQPARADPAQPTPPGRVADAPPPAPPVAPDLRVPLPLPPGVQARPVRPAMLSYAVPHTDGPRPAPAPAEPARSGLEFKTANVPGMKASPAIDDTYQLMPGLLPCVLDTAIQSDLPGPLLCHLPGPVYSPRGVLLMEAQTQIIGKYETMGRNGGNRLMAISTYAHTPNGIWVPLTGQSLADDLGRSGLDGAVDQHYLQRFGGAILLTLTESALGILQAAVSKGGNTYLSLNTGSSIGGVAQQILQSQINMPPTFSKNQGETIALFLDQPIDFSDSYRIRQVRQ